MKKIIALALAIAMTLALAACTGDNGENNTTNPDAEKKIGICQLVQHPSLDMATEGFIDAIHELVGEDVDIISQNAAGEAVNCATICNQFVSEGVDLIMANATGALQAAAAATGTIPVVGTSISHYGTALDISDWTGKTGSNITGVSDLAPLDQQAAVLKELCPEAETVGIIYCSAESNSVYQCNVITPYFENLGLNVNVYTFADSNDVASVVGNACSECDALYVPTDNMAASCAETIQNVALPAGKPIVTGDESTCKIAGIASLTLSYYDVGYLSGVMAAEILNEGKNPGDMEVKFVEEFRKVYNKSNCEALGITVPSDYVAIG